MLLNQFTEYSYTYAQAIQDLQQSGGLSLANIQALSLSDLNFLCEEIKCWRVYGNRDPKKLRAIFNAPNS
jgi:hypothetical protein